MQIEGLGLAAAHGYAYGHAKNPTEAPSASSAGQGPEALAQAPAQEEASQEATGSQGVINNLLAGHYKGVAEVRLRINFAQELAALDQQARDRTLGGSSAQLSALAADLQPMVDFSGQLEPALSAAQQQAADLQAQVQELAAGEGLSYGAVLELLQGVRQGFQNLAALISAELTPPEPPSELEPMQPPQPENNGPLAAPELTVTPEEPTVVDSPPAQDGSAQEMPAPLAEPPDPPQPEPAQANDPQADFLALASGFLEAWEESLPALLDRLAAELDQAGPLPPLSGPPDNNGGAYAKFLDQYQAMSQGQQPIPVSLDLSV